MAVISGTVNGDSIAPGGVSAGVTGGTPSDAADSIAGLGGADLIDAGGGADSADGGEGADTIRGGVGDDTLRGSLGNDSIDGGAGFDVLALGGDLNVGVTVVMTAQGAGTANAGLSGTDSFAAIEIIATGNFNDSLAGFAGAVSLTYLRGGGGNDTIDGAGNAFNVADYIFSANSVIVDLAAGSVVAAFPSGVSTIGTDMLVNVRAVRGSTGNNDIFKGAANGSFTIDGGSTSGSGGDYLDYRGLAGPITLTGASNGNGATVFFSGTVTKTGGTDTFANIRGIIATAGHDSLVGTASSLGSQTFLLKGMGGNDTIAGQNGIQNVVDYYLSPTGVAVDLGAGTASDGHGATDSLSGLHRARGSDAGSDTITGTSIAGFNNLFWGTSGNDRYEGGNQFNTVDYAGLGQEGFSGGNIEVTFLAPNAGLYGGGRATVLKAGGTQTDTLDNINQVNGSAGLSGTTGNDTLRGNTADVAYSWFNATLRGNAGDDIIHGYNVSGNRADYSNAAAAIVVNLQVSIDGQGNRIGSAGGANAGIGTDTLIAVRQVRGTNFNDTLTGSDLSDVFVLNGGGSQQVDGLAGTLNEVRFTGTDAVTIDLGTVAAPGGFGGYQGSIAKPNGLVTLRNISVAQGGAGNDTVRGTPGDNVLSGGSGSNEIDGRGGYDTVNYRFFTGIPIPTKGAVIDLANGVTGSATNPWDGVDTLLSIEGAVGTQFNDTITGASLGGGLRSYIRGDGGHDRLVANSAAVSADYASALSGVVVSLAAGLASDDGWFGGQDTLVGVTGARGGNFDDSILGSAAANRLEGNAGNDTLDGGLGSDSAAGGAGDDLYLVERPTDVVTELAGGGTDTVRSTIQWTLGAELENLVLLGTAKIGTGNALANAITGNAARNTLNGLAGNDTLVGGDGPDSLDGGTGADSLLGGTGNDTYLVDDAGDAVSESPAGGFDTVRASVDWTLGAELESLVLLAGAVDGTGNALNNRIDGNTAANLISGGAGFDTLFGGALGDTLQGGNGNDRLEGGLGRDSMEGGAQNDVFVWANPGDGRDTIAGFATGQDDLEISAAGFGGGLVAGVALTAAQFQTNATGLATTAAARFVFNTATGVLNFDADGNGAGAFMTVATFTGGAVVAAGDILVVA